MKDIPLTEKKLKKFDACIAAYVSGQEGDFSLSDMKGDPCISGNRDFAKLPDAVLVDGLRRSRLVFSRNDQVFSPRQHYFARARFIVSPTKEEIAAGILIPGHRFLPFYAPDILPWECTLLAPDGKAVAKKTVTRSCDSLRLYYAFLGWENSISFFVLDNSKNQQVFGGFELTGKEKVTISVYDFSQLYRDWNFRDGDGILCQTEDWLKGVYTITLVSAEECRKLMDQSADWVQKMERGFRKTFDSFKMNISIEEQISYAYYFAGRRILKKPPLHLGKLVNNSSGIYFVAFGMESRLWYEEQLTLSTLGIDKTGSRREFPGTFNGVLESLGVIFTEVEVEAYLRDALFSCRGNRDGEDAIHDAVLERLFPGGTIFFASEQTAQEFWRHFMKLRNRVMRTYNYFTDQKTGKIRAEVLGILDAHYAWMRSLDEQEDEMNPDNLPIQVFAGIVQAMGFLTSFLELLNKGEAMARENADQLVRYLPEIRHSLEEFREDVEIGLKTKTIQKGKAASPHLRLVSSGEKAEAKGGESGGQEDLKHLFVLRISLKRISPQIWRSIQVPGFISLGDLHRIIQIVMGWSDSHLHSFRIDGITYGIDSEAFDIDMEEENEDCYSLEDLNLWEKQRFLYTYDFGDNWEHQILVSKILSPPAGSSDAYLRPCCLNGKRACPPEDCGGVWGYEELLECISQPRKKRSRELAEWEEEFDPEFFDVDIVNELLLSGWEEDPCAD
ncbi:MAG: plasmid pRiA4b ORF-3 family protein [Spirochaetaceae bacterium]|jgi:hypothetical protein|nr:plasmid pRiA4b ORF-3 family protein [Spirochaetaceae bacterium]